MTVPGCENCGNDDGPHRYAGQDLCMDCLEMLHPGDPATDVLVHDHEVGLDFTNPTPEDR